MDQDLDLKDLRVPTFIPFKVEQDKKPKKTTKRKRIAQPDSKPNKRKAKKVVDGTLDDFIVADVKEKENEIWIGAAVNKKYGAYEVYFGENDQRNFNGIYEKENDLQDVDYAYILGTLKAIESLKSITTPYIVNTTCRDLPRAIAGRGKNFHYNDLLEKIRDAIKETGQDIQVRHLSGRTSTVEHKIAMVLAKDALELYLKPEENIIDEKVVEEKTIVEETTVVEAPAEILEDENKALEKVLSVEETSEENQVDNLIVGEIEQNFDEVTTTTTTTVVTTEVTLETKVDVIVSEKGESSTTEDMDLDQKSVQDVNPPPSSWFGIRNLLDILYAPFKTRKST